MLKAAENWAKFHQVILHVDVEFIIRQKSITKICMQTVVALQENKTNAVYTTASTLRCKVRFKAMTQQMNMTRANTLICVIKI